MRKKNRQRELRRRVKSLRDMRVSYRGKTKSKLTTKARREKQAECDRRQRREHDIRRNLRRAGQKRQEGVSQEMQAGGTAQRRSAKMSASIFSSLLERTMTRRYVVYDKTHVERKTIKNFLTTKMWIMVVGD